ncbi:MAG: hypothetical protein JNM36_18885 [Chitinophagales bacterium]|nr:hypothetical protein [Chitinophagales bacterium]
MKKIISFVIIVLMQIIVLGWTTKDQYLFEWQIGIIKRWLIGKFNFLDIDCLLILLSELLLIYNIITKKAEIFRIYISITVFLFGYFILLLGTGGWFDVNHFLRSSIPLFAFLLLCLFFHIIMKLINYINSK